MDNNNNIEDILNSFEGIQKAEGRPFMYTRVMARLKNEEANFWTKAGSFIARPAVVICCFIAIIGTNLFFIIHSDTKQEETIISSNSTAEILQNENSILASYTSYDLNR